MLNPDYLFEVSWEVCNKVGGIYTVLSTKVLHQQSLLGRHHIFVGPDVWMNTETNPEFTEDASLYRRWRESAVDEGIRVRVGYWNIPGRPVAILVDFKQFLVRQNEILTDMWNKFGVDSLSGDWDYKESALFGYAAGRTIESFYRHNLYASDKVVAQFHEWQAGAGLLHLKSVNIPIATVFTTHATVVGRSISGSQLPLHDHLAEYDGDAMASKLGVVSRHSLEKVSAINADVLTTVSETTARECHQFFGRDVDVITPNGFANGFALSDDDDTLLGKQIKYYQEAWSKALEKIVEKRGEFPSIREDNSMEINTIEINAPSWKSVMVTRRLPEALEGLETLSKNLWWCWNESAKALFKIISPEVWHNSGHNPRAVLDTVSIKRFNALAEDASFLAQLKDVMDEFNAYMQEKAKRTDPSIAYFCMEYGLDSSLQIYSGGLGILAGDYLKETSDMNVNLVAVGLLYRYGYFSQVLSSQGDQISQYNPQDFLKIPAEPALDANGEWLTTSVAFPGRNITARVWKVAVGRTDLYLLDTDFEANRQDDRQVTHQLYGGDWENRLKQELLLGIGGIRALRKLGINPQIYHCNEGHAAFTGLERLYEYIQNDNLNFSEALEVVRASSLFTTHTPVPAGHDAFEEGMLRQYIGHYPERLKIDWGTLMGLGRTNQNDANERFSMSVFAANISQNVNGVSMLHGQVSKDIFSNMYPGYLPEELHISYVTNGVHYPTWASKEWKQIHARVFGPEFATHHYDKKCFEGIYKVSDEEIWNTRDVLKKDLVYTIIKKLSDPQIGSHYSPSQIVKIKKTLRDDVLTIGFARRFATYKRAMLLFSNLDRLDTIVNNPERPVQFVFAGKAHPADKAGQDLIRQIVEISKQDRFIGKIIFVPGYDITLAKRLVQGVDVWLNNPARPLEASGTSGEKASMNGVMHFSVLDGWWVEGYKEGAGWALPQEKTYDDNFYQNELDSATIYTIIENEIAPTYYAKDPATGRSAEWIKYIKNTVAQVACNFTTNRMLTDYVNQYYDPQSKRASELVADNYAKARGIAAWKKRVLRYWPDIEVVSYRQPDSSYSLSAENPMQAEVVLNIGDLNPEDVGVEMLFSTYDAKGSLCIREKFAFNLVEFKDGIATYRTEVLPERTGMYQVATRLYPKNENLPHRQDFPIVRWL